jgi:hypothetical protein
MRLFQAQNFYGDISSPPPPPHFSIDREATRIMPVYLNQYRDGRRLPTPEKVAVMELSNSFERRRLGKHQQILTDISERCRAQEITDLSNKLSAKKNIHKLDKANREMTFYATTFMGSQPRRISPDPNEVGNSQESPEDSSRPLFEKNYKQFPARRIMRQHTKFDFLRQNTSFPQITPPANVNPILPKSSVSDSQVMTLRARLAQRQQINGPIQLDHYTTPRPDLAPLVLPTLERYNTGIQSERLERSEMCFSTSRLTLGPRTKTQLTMDSTRTGNAGNSSTVPPLRLANYGHELSQLQLTSGHSPPPNSVHEVFGDNT